MEMKLYTLLLLAPFYILKFPVKVNATNNACRDKGCGPSLEWLGCYETSTNHDIKDIYNFELLFKEDISEYINNESVLKDWKQSMSILACKCANVSLRFNFKVLLLQFPAFCYGRQEDFPNMTKRDEGTCERQNYSIPCSQPQSLCIGMMNSVSIYRIVTNTTKSGNYFSCQTSTKKAQGTKNPSYASSFSREESKQKLQNIFSMLEQSFDVDGILSLIREAVLVLKRPEIYQDLNVFKEQEEKFLDVLSYIIDEPYKEIWRKSQKIHHLVTLIEEVSKTLLLSMEFARKTNNHYHYPTKNIEITSNFTQENQARIQLNDSAISITQSDKKGPFGVGTIVYKGINDVFTSAVQRSFLFSGLPTKVGSHVVSITAMHDGKAIHRVNGSISFKISDYDKIPESTSSFCVYWEENENLTLGGAWSTDGLSLIDSHYSNHSNSTYYTCQTSHLTNFAILMEVSEYKISQSDKLALKIITYIGCTISLFCLLLTIFTLPVLRLRDTRFKIHFHLCLALAAAQVVFLSGISAVSKKTPCMIVAILLHYFFTVAFLWMLVEGIHLYQKVVIAYEKKAIKPQYYYVIAWGTPIIIVGISAAVHRDGYGTNRGCWLSLKEGLRWSFIGPVIFVMTANIVILVRVLVVMVNLRKDPLKKQKYAKIRMALKGLVILLPLLGLTWLFGLMSVNSDTILFKYLFSIFNSLQGTFIFVFNYLLNKDVRTSFRRTLHRRTTTTSL